MEIQFRIYKNILIAFIQDEVDHHTATSIRYGIDRAFQKFDCENLVMDFSKVRFMDSSGIGLILGRYKRMRKRQGNLYLSGCHRHVEKVLKMSDVFSLVQKFSSAEEAIMTISGDEKLELEVVDE